MIAPPFANSSSYPVRTTASLAYYVDGEEAFQAIAKAMEAAQRYVYVTCAYASLNFRLRPPADEQLLDLCGRVAARGVKVALLVWLPASATPDTIPESQAGLITGTGVQVRYDRAKCPGLYPDLLGCHHQKTFVIDGAVAFVGGINMVQSYWDTRTHASVEDRRVSYDVAGAAARAQAAADSATLPLHDAFSSFTGPAVADVEANFVERWNGASHPVSGDVLAASPAAADPGAATRIQVVRTIAPNTYPHTANGEESIKEAMLNLVSGAQASLYFENQYFFDDDVVAAIRAAGERGVRIVGLLCRKPDAGQAVGVLETFLDARSEDRLQWTRFNPTLRESIQLYTPMTTDLPTKDIYVHAKVMIVDDRYVLLGSANIAFTSLDFHSEMCALVDDASKAKALRLSLFAEHLCLATTAVPPDFREGADLWASQGEENARVLDGGQPPKSRVVPLSDAPADGADDPAF